MAPTISSAKLTLSCPLFAADFDPRNNSFLLVAGGGGEGRSGVGNKIGDQQALLNTSKRNELSQIVDVELSRDEDSVTSLAAAQPSNESIIALAGINSSLAEQKRGNNQHLRSFQIDYPPRRSAVSSEESTDKEKPALGKTTALSRASLFRTKGAESGSDTYQRILRLSPWRNPEAPRVGAIATGMVSPGEIVLFNATASAPTEKDVIGRSRLGDGEEAEDVDVTHLEGDEKGFKVAYTNGGDVFTAQISSKTRSNAAPEVTKVYSTPLPQKGALKPKFRALRFLSPTTLLLLKNHPNRGGSELVVLSLPTSKKSEGTIVRRKKLRRTVKIGLGLDVCNLGQGADKQQQFIIAVTGSDQSVEILTVDFDPRRGYGKLQPYTSLRDVHPFSVTKLCFSTFIQPAHPITPEVGPQYVKLATVSMGNTVVVHTFPISPLPPSSRTPRYVLVNPNHSTIWDNTISGFSALLSILTVCFLLQAFMEIRGLTPPSLGASDWLPPSIRDNIARPYIMPPLSTSDPTSTPVSSSDLPTATVTTTLVPPQAQASNLHELLRSRRAEAEDLDADIDADIPTSPYPLPSIIVRCTDSDILIETADAISPSLQAEDIRPWETLEKQEQVAWKHRLSDEGHWALEEEDMDLRGVLFGDGDCGGVVRDEL